MKALLDSQALILWVTDGALPRRARAAFSPDNELFVSVVSPWEMLIKRRFRDIAFTPDLFWKSMEQIDATLLPVMGTHIDTLAKLRIVPGHNDPFDRMLIAQAKCEGLTLVGSDRYFHSYDVPVLWS